MPDALSVQEQIAYHVSALKTLRASMLRSDWHAAFEAALHLLTDKYGDAIRLLVEEELGIEPPRADFIVLLHDLAAVMQEAIFKHFRSVNLLEYKNPKDDLNETVLWKAIGYAGLYISNRGVSADDMTITIFRSRRNEAFFDRLLSSGQLETGAVAGIYTVRGESRIETRIIITDELEGEQYAAYRALSDKPSEDDLKTLVRLAKEDEGKRVYVRVIFNHMAKKHPDLIEKLREEDEIMNEEMMAIFKDEIERTNLKMLADMIDKKFITIERAAEFLGMTVSEFKEAVERLKVTA